MEEDEENDRTSSCEGDDGLSVGLDPEPTTSKEEMDTDNFPFEVLTTEEIVQHMTDSIRDVNHVVEISPTTTRILLNHFKWDKEKLYERYYDGDQERLFKEAHVVGPYQTPTGGDAKESSRPVTSDREDCGICFTDLPESMLTGLACGHRFCCECWNYYLTTKIMAEGMSQTISCAAHECDILVDDQTVMELVADSKVKLKYQHLITNSFVECNRRLRWCPQPECNNAIKVQYVDMRPVTCSCSHTFCFLCGEEWHDPIPCHLLKKWLEKCNVDSETSNWIASHTKQCPKCNVVIEKDGGCNHVSCSNPNCRAEFCWVCLGPWELHGDSWYNCSRYDEDESKTAREAQERSRATLMRYLFFYRRYLSHMQSLKFERKLYAAAKRKVEHMKQIHDMSWAEAHFLKKGVDVLCQCRQTLMYTYVFAYYLCDNNQSVIFEHNHRDLVSATENLSEYLERNISQDNLQDIKQEVQDKYRYCDSRRRALLELVHEGYEKDWWKHTE